MPQPKSCSKVGQKVSQGNAAGCRSCCFLCSSYDSKVADVYDPMFVVESSFPPFVLVGALEGLDSFLLGTMHKVP